MKTKATDVVTLRKYLRRLAPDLESKIILKLSPEALELYENAIVTNWIAQDIESEIMRTAANALYPGDPYALQQIGREMAKQTLTGIYKIFLRIPTVSSVMSRAVLLWKIYYDHGVVEIEITEKNRVVFSVTGCSDLLLDQVETATGFLYGLMDVMGIKKKNVIADTKNRAKLRWDIVWE